VSVLVIDVGTSGLRAGVVRPDGSIDGLHHRPFPPQSPFPGLVEFDAPAMATAVLEVAHAALADAGPVVSVGVTAQRASTVVWDRATGEPIGPGLGWQDLRTVVQCIMAKAEHGLALAPNQSATKIAWLLDNVAGARDRDLCFGTVDTWIAWILTGGRVHVTDRSNAGVTGLMRPDGSGWSSSTCSALGISESMLPTLVDTSGPITEASALPGAPVLAALVGDQQGSLIGQSCVAPGQAKATFGTGGMLDMVTGPVAPSTAARAEHGTFPIVAWSRAGEITWGTEAIMLSAGTNVEWLVSDLGILATAEESHAVASLCDTTDGVVYVPALMGLGTPYWDYGARGTLLGLTRGSGRPQITRAVLEGVAQRGADLVEAAEADGGREIPVLRVDGGMSRNPTFVQALADATGRRVEVSRHTEATTLGAAYLAGLATGVWAGLDEISDAWQPSAVVDPVGPSNRDRWRTAVQRSQGWIPDLSALDF
jgi:glycerol kinase